MVFCYLTFASRQVCHVGGDKGMGRYTFVGHRGSRLVAYVTGTQNLSKFVKRFDVSELNNLQSDHFLIFLTLWRGFDPREMLWHFRAEEGSLVLVLLSRNDG
jgi:hypothetical protein